MIAANKEQKTIEIYAIRLSSVRHLLHRFLGSLCKSCFEKKSSSSRKETGKTSHIERFNNIMRQRISRLVHSTLPFLKKLENYIGAIWYFIHHACLQAQASNRYIFTTTDKRKKLIRIARGIEHISVNVNLPNQFTKAIFMNEHPMNDLDKYWS